MALAGPVLAASLLAAQSPLAPEVVEARLGNGVRVLVAERPGTGMVRAGLFFRGGAADTGALPAAAATLLVRTLFGELRPEDLGPQPALDAILVQAEGLREDLRVEELRRGRTLGSTETSELAASLQASLRRVGEELDRLRTPADQPDLLDALGAVRHEVAAEPDALVHALDLPAAALPEWADLEARRLRAQRLARLPAVRRELRGAASAQPVDLRILLENALPATPYGGVLAPGRLQGVLLADLAGYARQALAPGRLAVVLAGEVKIREVLPLLEATFGSLPGGTGEERIEPDADGPAPLAAKRVQVREAGAPHLRIGWPCPPLAHPDRLPLELLARLLARRSNGQGMALPAFVGGAVKVGVPGSRRASLLVVEAAPEEGRSLAEAEQEVFRAVLRLQEEPVAAEAFEGALRQVELDTLAGQADAADLVRRLGLAWCQSGDWRAAFPDLRGLRSEGPAAVLRVARSYLRPERAVLVLVDPDFTRDPGDAHQAELLHLLRAQALARLGDPVRAEALALQSMEQVRMLSRDQREQLLRALRPEVKTP